MFLPIKKGWRAWTDGDGQVGGRRVDFSSPRAAPPPAPANATAGGNSTAPPQGPFPALSFVTVRNSGHMVPYDSPQRAQQLLFDFLSEGEGQRAQAPPTQQQEQVV